MKKEAKRPLRDSVYSVYLFSLVSDLFEYWNDVSANYKYNFFFISKLWDLARLHSY